MIQTVSAQVPPVNIVQTPQKMKKVPVINVTLGDKELGLLAGPELNAVDLEKVQKLLEDKIYATRNLQSFHEAALRKVAKTYSNGFLLRNCTTLGRILSLCSARFSDQPNLVPAVVDIIKICSLGLITQRTSHEAAYEKQAIYLIDEISQLLMCSADEVRQAACQCLLKLFSFSHSTETYQGTERCSLLYNRFIIEQSDAVSRALLAIQSFDLTDATELLVIKLFQKLTKLSGVICCKLLENGAATLFMQRLQQWSYNSEPCFRTVEIIWNLHDMTMNNNFSEALASFVEQLSDTKSLSPLYSLFMYHLHRPHTAASRQLRNDALILASLVAKHKPAAAFLETGFAQLILKLATVDEFGLKSILAVANNREDFELKKLLINVIALLSRDFHTRNLLSSHGVIPAFSVYVCAGAPPGKREWSEAQREEVQLHAIAALAEIVPLLPMDVLECRLPTRMLLMLDWAADKSPSYEGSGNSFYGAAGFKSKRAQLRYCTRLLLSSISEGGPGTAAIIDALVEQGAVDVIIRVVKMIIEQQEAAVAENNGSIGNIEEAVAVEIQADLLLTLSIFCSSGDPNSAIHYKELFGAEGCSLICRLLRTTPVRLSSGLGHARLLLAVLDCLWSAGIGSDMTEDALLENGSIFALLDLIQVTYNGFPTTSTVDFSESESSKMANFEANNSSTAALTEIAMGCIVDLLDNPRSLRHLLAWRGTRGISAPHLFCEMWRQQKQANTSAQEAKDSETLLADENILCSRIYAAFLRLGWSDVPGLLPEDHITRPEIDHYLDDLTCQMWRCVAEELASESLFEPTEEDTRMLQMISVIAREKATLVIAEQEDATQASEQAQLSDETQYYEQISSNQQLRQRSFERYADLVARTSRHNALTIAKQRQLLAVDASRVRDPGVISNYHATADIPNIGTTVFSGREIAVDSEPCEITGGRLAVYNAAQQQLQLRLQQEQQQQRHNHQTMPVTAATLVPGQTATQHSLAVPQFGNKSVSGSTASMAPWHDKLPPSKQTASNAPRARDRKNLLAE